MNKNLRTILALSMVSAMVWSCSGGNDEGAQTVEEEKEKKDTTDPGPKPFYQIPTPNELFTVIKEIGGKSRTDLMNPVSKADGYTDNFAKSINFGIYSADLAYSAAFEMGNPSLEYFKVIEKMADQLGVKAAFDQTVFERLEKNINNGDSLVSISNDTYFEAYNYLEENEKGATLGLIVTGGWIESMYIVTNLVDKYADNNPIIERIAGQKYTLENLQGFLTKYSDDPDVGMAVAELEKIQAVMDMMEVSGDVNDSKVTVEGDVNVISGGQELKMTKETFDLLKDVVKEVRDIMVGANS